MSSSFALVSSARTYRGNSEISFYSDDQSGLFVTIDTKRLHIRSIQPTETEYGNYASLFGDQKVMEKFATGQTKTKEEIRKIHDIWIKRWHEGDPYSGFTVFKKDTNDFLGHVCLGHRGPGEAEIGYLFHRAYWGKGYGSEAVTAIVKEYAPATVQEGYVLKGKVLKKINATTRPDNPASIRILEKVGMNFEGIEKKYGALRHHYSLILSGPQKNPAKKLQISGAIFL